MDNRRSEREGSTSDGDDAAGRRFRLAARVEGGVTGIRFRRYDENGDSHWRLGGHGPATNRFVFEHGRITGAQFMAELTGMDSGSNPLEDTVRGFEGTVHGEFYGPARGRDGRPW